MSILRIRNLIVGMALLAVAMSGCAHSASKRSDRPLPRPAVSLDERAIRHSPRKEADRPSFSHIDEPPTRHRHDEPPEPIIKTLPGMAINQADERIEESGVARLESPQEPPAAKPQSHPVILALEAYLRDRPDEAISHLGDYEADDQELLLYLLPIIAQVEKGGLLTRQLTGEEVMTWIGVLDSCRSKLQAKAPLRIEKIALCRAIRGFGDYQSFDRDEFRPGDFIHLYVELRNLADCVDAGGMCSTNLASVLEILDARGNRVWRSEPEQSWPDQSHSVRKDHFTPIGLYLPEIPPGYYTLRVYILDQNTGREAADSIEFRVEPMTAVTRK